MYRRFDVIMMEKIHYNKFFDYIKNPNELGKRISSNDGVDWLIKKRPALVIKKYRNRYETEGKDKYLVIPFTSKRTISAWIGGFSSLRIEIRNPHLQNEVSYLMLDAIITITEDQILGFYRNKYKALDISKDQRKILMSQLRYKYKRIFS